MRPDIDGNDLLAINQDFDAQSVADMMAMEWSPLSLPFNAWMRRERRSLIP